MKRLLLISLFFLSLFCISCSEDNPDETSRQIQISQQDLIQTFGHEAEERFVQVTHSKLFDLKSSDDTWCRVKRTGNGLRITGITITVDKNTMALERAAQITIWSKDVDPVVIEVKQSADKAVMSVLEKSVLIKKELSFNLTVKANFDIEFVLPDWIKAEGSTSEGIYSFLADPLPEGQNSREGDIKVKAKNITGVEPIVIPVKQEEANDKKLPEKPQIPECKYSAKWLDLYFVKDGYRNGATNEDKEGTDRVELRTGSKVPASVWSDEVKAYVSVYPGGSPTDTYFAAVYDDRQTSNFNAEPTAVQGGFTLETYLKVTDVTQEYIIPFANLDGRGNGQLGLGVQIISSEGRFTCATFHPRYEHLEFGKWNTEKYYHILVVYNKSKGSSSNTMDLYIDGSKVGESAPMGDWTTVVWDKIRGIGIGGNFVQPSDDNPNIEMRDGMVGEIAFFRWYAEEFTSSDVAARYSLISDRAKSVKFSELKKMIETTLPAKASSGVSSELQNAIKEGIALGESLIGNYETTEETVIKYLDYADNLLKYE